MTVQVMWKVLAWVVTFQLPQQTVIQIASQGVFTRCSLYSLLLNVLLINSKWYLRKMKKVLETFYMK